MQRRRLFLPLAILLAVSFAVEVFIFNFRYFYPLLFHAKTFNYPASGFSQYNGCDFRPDGLYLSEDNSSFVIDKINARVFNIRLNCAPGSGSFKANVLMSDDNFSQYDIHLGTWEVRPDVPESQSFSVISSGNCRRLTVSFSGLQEKNVIIRSVDINCTYFHFKILRVLLLYLFLALVCVIFFFKPWNIRYSHDRVYQRRLFFAVLLCGAAAATCIVAAAGSDTCFSKSVEDENDKYQLLTQAFLHERVTIGTPDSNLVKLSNPYDYSERRNAGVAYMWDTVYYKGHYYAYFGIAPVLLLLLPFKLLTGFYLPTPIAVLIFVVIAMYALLLIYRNIVEMWYPGTDLLSFLSGAAACVFAFNLIWLCGRPYFYEIAFSSGQAFLMLAFNMLLVLYRSRRFCKTKLFFAGLFFALAVASRPNLVFYLAASIPFLIVLLREGRVRQKLGRLAVFGAPLAVVALLVMAYNYIRFGSPLEFGEKYQLTVSDISFNKATDFSKLINGVFQYLFQPLSVDLRFPFFHVVDALPTNITQYYYNFPIAGVFAFPIFLSLPAAVYILNRLPHRDVKKRFVALLLLVSAIMIPLEDLLGGVVMRYQIDHMIALGVACIILWMEILRFFRLHGAAIPVAKLFCLVSGFSCLISLCISLAGECNNIMLYCPRFYLRLSMLFEFWR